MTKVLEAKAKTTIQVFTTDRQALKERFGNPTTEAMRSALKVACPHDELKRKYVTAQLGNEFDVKSWVGFYCPECNTLVFPGLEKHWIG